jgi:plastocyanin
MNLRRAAAGALALSTVVALGACTKQDNGNNTLADQKPSSTASSGAPAAGAPRIEAKDNEFLPRDLTVSAGDVTITLHNTGAAPHTFTMSDPKVAAKVDVNADSGKTVDIKLTGLKAGKYKFVCKYHEALGMTGELTVT